MEPFKVACSSCNLRELCLPVGMSVEQTSTGSTPSWPPAAPSIVATRCSAPATAFASLYAVRTGFFKTCVSSEDGRDQVTGFQMAGELLGLDGIGTDRHTCDAIALEDAQGLRDPLSTSSRTCRASCRTCSASSTRS